MSLSMPSSLAWTRSMETTSIPYDCFLAVLEILALRLIGARNPQVAAVLLENRPCCPITVALLEAKRERPNRALMAFLLRREPSIVPTEAIVMRVLEENRSDSSSREQKEARVILNYIWSRNPGLQIKAHMLECRRLQPDTVTFLLGHANGDLRVTDEMLHSSGFVVSAAVLRILLSHDPAFQLTEELVVKMKRATRGSSLRKVILEHKSSTHKLPPTSCLDSHYENEVTEEMDSNGKSRSWSQGSCSAKR